MTADQPLNETYRRVLEIATQKRRELGLAKPQGKDHGAAAWLARYLGTSRQLLFYWSRTGFPEEYIPKVAKLAQIEIKKLRTKTIDLPEDTWEAYIERLPKSLINQAVVRK